jgi:hypothetical protein
MTYPHAQCCGDGCNRVLSEAEEREGVALCEQCRLLEVTWDPEKECDTPTPGYPFEPEDPCEDAQ